MKKIFYLFSIAVLLVVFTSCEKSETETAFSKAGRKVNFSFDDRRGEFLDAGDVGTEGIDLSGYISNINGGLYGKALIRCDKAGKYGYQVLKEPYGACDLNFAEFVQLDSTSYYDDGDLVSTLSKNEIFYEENVEAGALRMIYISQGYFTDYEYEVRIRYISE